MAAATLGEFLDAANGYFADTVSAMRGGLWDRVGAVREIGRLATAMTRYLDIVTRPDVVASDDASEWELSAAYMREGARTASTYLASAARSAVRDLPPTGDPAVRQLGLAVDALMVGGDLLWSHVGTDQEGHRVPRSDWARLLRSEPFALAVADEITGWARRGLHILDDLTGAPGQLHGLSGPALRGARDLLSRVAGTQRQAGSADYDMVNRRELLRTLPLRALPDRVRPGTGESDTGLCDGIAVSARRLREAAFAASTLPGNSPYLTREVWMHTARASAVISDLACGMTGRLADRSAALGIPAAAEAGMRDAAVAFSHACTAWRQVTWMWRIVRTDTQFPSSPAVTETGDLVLRLGRLLHGKPGWTPAAGSRAEPRDPGSLARGRPELIRVLTALHDAADAVTRSAVVDLGGVRDADAAGRLYMPNRVVADCTTRSQHVPLSGHRAHLLMNAYHIAINASLHAVIALDGAALGTGAPSKVLSLRRAAAGNAPVPEPGYELDPEAFTRQRLPYFSRPARSPLRPYKELDADAVVHAYKDAGLSVGQCAGRFTSSVSTIRSVLAFNGYKPRPRWEHGNAAADLPGQASAGTPEEPPRRERTAAQVASLDTSVGVSTVPRKGTTVAEEQAQDQSRQARGPRHAQGRHV